MASSGDEGDVFSGGEGGDQTVEEKQRICKVRERTNAVSRSQKSKNNALQDEKLKEMLESADEITSPEHFTYWKDEFLDQFKTFLNPEGTATAREADDAMFVLMQKLTKTLLMVKHLCSNGDISEEKVTVRGQNNLNEMVSEMANLERAVAIYWPKTQEDEEQVGYTKFELGAVLVRDGFRVYSIMITTRDYLIGLRDGPLKGDKFLTTNSRSIMNYYLNELDSFCDTMADLGMYKLMNKMVEMYKVRPRKKKKKEFDRKTMDALSDTSDSDTINNGRMFRRSKVDFKAVMNNGWKSGVTGTEVLPPEIEEEDGGADPNAKGKSPEDEEKEEKEDTEFIYYYDPVTEKVGKISRRKCVMDNLMIKRGENGEEKQEGAAEKWDGEEGKEKLIWKLKDALKGKPQMKKEQKKRTSKRTSTKAR